ncbi:phage tail sheath C-terminal domain-containing protein [Paenibacillus sp. MMS18-CY102]|uniref:phage tail sheath C-terminal domain-containing protein n=1 Tax=Paenibacillus sp. MMS18-CY102 TaxID=2682849 RepID=UPI001365ED16|nr:phage tail sheath C-terminal domain-containing protein [Paenibacillus sp. MMS18-CY102]MWC26634.1 phage tail sheath protein [Paenibacillus sp. MMS18-CY102]
MTIGLPSIEIEFKKLAETAIARSSEKIAVLVVKDDTNPTYAVKEYKSSLAVDADQFTAANVQYIKDVLLGGGSKVIVVPVETTSTDVVAEAIAALGSRKYHWIGLADGTAGEHSDLSDYVKEQEVAKKGIKAVVYKAVSPDSQRVVNFTNANVTYVGGATVTGEKYIARLLGILAGLPMTRSSTYLELTDLEGVTELSDLNVAVGNGELVLFNDDGVIRIARGVNSLKTLVPGVTEDFKKIIIVESMDLMRSDIASTFKNSYLGKFKNKYDNQVLFLSAVNTYFDALATDDILDNEFDNRADVDIEEQRQAWLAIGKTDAVDWNDHAVKNNTFGSKVFLAGHIKITDAMEDLSFGISLQ